MPVYDYECGSCGVFTALRPMAQSAAPLGCPDCGIAAPRAFLVAPARFGMDASRRNAMAVNEKSAHEPRSSKNHVHGPNCGCGAAKTKKAAGGNDARSFPKARPWMISH